MLRPWIAGLAATAAVGCYSGRTPIPGGALGADDTEGPSAAAGTEAGDPQSDTETPDDTDSGGSTDTADQQLDPEDAAQMCQRWNADRASLTEGTWSGDAGSCSAGDVSADGRQSALRLINLYRWLADLPPIETSPMRDAMAQSCAVLMHANGSLSHTPPTSWNCYSQDGASGAGNSNIASTAGVAAIGLYMIDRSSPDALGHRRWILSNSIGPTGLGSTNGYSCMWTLGGSGQGQNQWTAWPAPGPFPVEAIAGSFSSIDESGWSIQSDSIDLSSAQVNIVSDGQDRPVLVTPLLSAPGIGSGVSMIPQGWTTEAGRSYEVTVSGVGAPIEYTVHAVACGG